MESDGLFWGLTLVTGKIYNQTPSTGFHISMAALEPDDGPKKPATIFVKYNGAEFALCTLCPGSIYQQTLDLNFATGEEVTFFIKGSQATVDLTGYIMPEEDFDESQLSDDDGLSEQDMSEEEDDVSHDEDDLSMEEEDDDEEGVEEIVQKVKAKKPNEVSENATSQNKKKGIADKKNKKNSKTDNSMLADVVDAQVEISEKETTQSVDISDIPTEKEIVEIISQNDIGDDKSELVLDSTLAEDVEKLETVVVSEKSISADVINDTKSEVENDIIENPSELSKTASDNVLSENISIDVNTEDPVKTDKLKKKKKKKNKNKSANNSMESNEILDASVQSLDAEDDQITDNNESISQDLSPQSLKRKLDESANTGETENKKKKKKKNKKKQAIDESLNSSVASDAGNTTADSPQPAKTENTKKSNNTPKRVLQGGIIMQDLKEGHGPVANNGKMVHVYYKGALKSGKEFDSCLSGKPFKFRLGKQEVIKGWDVGLSGMKVGGKRKLVIPANQAYGNKNLPGIPSNSTLMFDIELKAVN